MRALAPEVLPSCPLQAFSAACQVRGWHSTIAPASFAWPHCEPRPPGHQLTQRKYSLDEGHSFSRPFGVCVIAEPSGWDEYPGMCSVIFFRSAREVKPFPGRENLPVWESSQFLSQPIAHRATAAFESPRSQGSDLAHPPRYVQAWWCKHGLFRSAGPNP
jgi:hypothetical protein